MTNKYNADYRQKLAREQAKFNKQSSDEASETASQVTSATRISKPGQKKTLSKASRSSSPEKPMSDRTNDPMGTIDRSDNAFDPHPEQTAANLMDEEDEQEAERLLEAEKAKKKDGLTEYPEFFLEDREGETFNPAKKYGNIENEGQLIYENITSSYPVNLPVEMYQKHIMETMPKKEDGGGHWFIRPHHLENLTKHPKSINDDVLNTRYYSHYNVDHGKKKEDDIAQDAVDRIEGHLAKLKSEM